MFEEFAWPNAILRRQRRLDVNHAFRDAKSGGTGDFRDPFPSANI
jgi:hypothetical protein